MLSYDAVRSILGAFHSIMHTNLFRNLDVLIEVRNPREKPIFLMMRWRRHKIGPHNASALRPTRRQMN